ncbi:MAG: serine/threonine protein kinase [Polyangiaceae bacterium]|nr:serine/threonine protein kinase [Polyangiaceae bacterium]
MGSVDPKVKERVIGRYALYGVIASGGLATGQMFLDEARLAARIQHPNVVQTLDVVSLEGELFIVMEYVKGEALARLSRAARKSGELVPPRVAATILSGLLHGLHAAHEACDEHGRPLGIVHRDVSPQNVLVGTDGVARVLDFGVAKAAGRLSNTREGQLKGKFAYMAPEQIRGGEVDRRTDIYAAAIILWEVLTGRRMISGENEAIVLSRALEGQRTKPSELNANLSKALDVVTMRGLEMDPARRYSTAREMATALERAVGLASQREVSEWVERVAGDVLAERAGRIKEIESRSTVSAPRPELVSELVAHARAAEQESDAPTQFYQSGSNSQVSGVAVPPGNSSITSNSVVTAPELPAPDAASGVSRGNATVVTASPRHVNVALIVLGGVALLFAGIATAALVLLARDRDRPASLPVPPASTPVAALAPPASATAQAPVSAAPSASTAPSASAPKALAAGTVMAPRGEPRPPKDPPKDPPKPPKTAGDCDVPYTIDATGIKRPKPQCF